MKPLLSDKSRMRDRVSIRKRVKSFKLSHCKKEAFSFSEVNIEDIKKAIFKLDKK